MLQIKQPCNQYKATKRKQTIITWMNVTKKKNYKMNYNFFNV